MFHSILITGGTDQNRLQTAKDLTQNPLQPDPDVLILAADLSITIKDVRRLEIFLSKKPYQASLKIALITDAAKLTLPAQQALLKTLEEPPAHSQIILLSGHQSLVLPTIISRCHHIRLISSFKLEPDQLKHHQTLFNQICPASPAGRLNILTAMTVNKTTGLEFCQSQLIMLRRRLLNQPSTALTLVLRHLAAAITKLQANTNPKLTLENLILSYPKAKILGKIDT